MSLPPPAALACCLLAAIGCARPAASPTTSRPAVAPAPVSALPLHDAAEAGDAATVARLLDGGADPQQRDPLEGGTPLHRAATPAVVRLLLARGAGVAASNEGYTPVYAAAMRGRVAVIEALLAAGADLGDCSPRGDTLMHAACIGVAALTEDPAENLRRERGRGEVVEYLVAHGADPDARNRDGETPLHVAARMEPDMVRRLVRLGADPTIRSADGKLPIDLSREFMESESTAVLQAAMSRWANK